MTLLNVHGLDVHHGQLQAIRSLDLTLEEGEVLAVIGANGAGKSTLLRALAGGNTPTAGRIVFGGSDVTRLPAHRRVAAGIALVPEGRRLFRSLTVEENLLTGSYRGRPGPWTLQRVYELFPWMADRRRQNSANLSGGEQQSVAIGRALMSNPKLILIDELSLGLAPIIVRRIYDVLPTIVENGTSALIVEQDVSQALRVSDKVQCLLEGRSVLSGSPDELTPSAIEQAYFGLTTSAASDAAHD
ncbi:ABC transporter ATP-binding protein [Streptomyces incanus]|uniref:ABC transporter ATP-binding protein n=1 Tax=Streptomyces incanus TaxID=887453 RepID=A0ABW0XI66_9ACTN